MFRFDYAQLAALAAVVEEGSYERAARALNITQPAVSNRIKALEDTLDMQVVTRERPRMLTEAGRLLHRHFRKIEAIEGESLVHLAELKDSRLPTCNVRVVADEFTMSGWMHKAVGRARAEMDVVVDLMPGADHADDLLRAGKAHGALSLTREPPIGFQSLELGVFRCRAVASPAFAERHLRETPDPERLLAAPAFSIDRNRELISKWTDRHLGFGAKPKVHHIPFLAPCLGCCMEGTGWSVVPEHLLTQAPYRDGLVDLFPTLGIDVPVYWVFPRSPLKVMRKLTRILEAEAGRVLTAKPHRAQNMARFDMLRMPLQSDPDGSRHGAKKAWVQV